MIQRFDTKIDELTSERRDVTILFADISGFTEMSENLDPEEVKNMLNNCFDYLVPIIEKYGGFIDKFIGDEVMALFGAPFSLGNEPEKSLRAALELMQTIEIFNLQHGCKLGIHVGINSGLVIAGGIGSKALRQYTVIGDAVNLASRLCSMAANGEIFVGNETYLNCKQKFLFEERTNIQIKGKAKETKVFKLSGIRQNFAQETWFGNKFVGRKKEIKLLKELIYKGQQKEGSRFMLLSGKPGIGKSRILLELRNQQGLKESEFIYCRADEFSAMQSFSFLTKLLQQLLNWDLNVPKKVKEEEIETLLIKSGFLKSSDAKPLLLWLMNLADKDGVLGVVDSFKPEVFQGRLINILEKCLITILTKNSIILALDDFNFIDDLSLSIIERIGLFQNLDCLFIATISEDIELSNNHQKCIKAFGEVEKVKLPSLDWEACFQLVQLLTGREVLQANLLSEIIEKADGNPNFLIELFTLYKSIGNDRSAFTSWFKNTPVNIKAITLSRIDNLSTRAKIVIGAAAVISSELSIGLIRRLLSQQLGEQEISIGWQELVAGNFIYKVQGSIYSFSSKLVGDTAYSILLKTTKRELHLKAAKAIEELDLTSRNRYAINIANHFELAEEKEAALKYLLIAARQTYSVFENYQCLDLLARAIKILEEQLPILAGNRLKLCKTELIFSYELAGELYGLTLQPQLAEDAYIKGIKLIGSKNKLMIAKFYGGLAKAFIGNRDGENALKHINRALALIENCSERKTKQGQGIWINCILVKGKAIYFSNQASLLNSYLKQIGSRVIKDGDANQVLILNDLSNLNDLVKYAYHNIPQSTIDRALANLEKAKLLNDPKEILWATNLLGFLLLWQDKLDESEVYLKQGLILAEKISAYESVITLISYLILIYRKKQQVQKLKKYIALGLKLSLQTRSNYLLHFKAAELAYVMKLNKKDELAPIFEQVSQLSKFVPPKYPLKFIVQGPLLKFYLEKRDYASAHESLKLLMENGQKKWDPIVTKTFSLLAMSFSETDEKKILTAYNNLSKLNNTLKMGLW
jgi:class 3 adenylate cyclase